MQRLSSKIIALAVTIAPVSAFAEPLTVTRDGTTYVYSVSQRGAAQIITGRSSDGQRISLRVAKGWVTGTFGSSQVRFNVSEVATSVATAATQTAAR